MNQIEQWSEFNVAMVGATAALAGLAIVAASVNIGDIVKAPAITARLAAGIGSLVLAILGSGIGLVPEMSPVAYGWTVLVLALAASVFAFAAARRIYENRAPENRARPLKVALGFVAPAAYVVGGVLLIAGATASGLLALAIGCVAAIAAAIVISWVVLVEVLR